MSTDRRASLRERLQAHGVTVTLFLIRKDGAYTKHLIEPTDFSSTGMGFEHDEPMPLGRHCEFEIAFKGQCLHVISKVVRCTERGPGRHSIGVHFDQVLTKGTAPAPSA